jgi:hypothetical protein
MEMVPCGLLNGRQHTTRRIARYFRLILQTANAAVAEFIQVKFAYFDEIKKEMLGNWKFHKGPNEPPLKCSLH